MSTRDTYQEESSEPPSTPGVCNICGSQTSVVDTTRSAFTGHLYELAQCPACHYSCVVNPRTDFGAIYNDAYYRGQGVALRTDYESGLRDSRAVQGYEWRAIVEILTTLMDVSPSTRWLDYGCGLGGLVRYARAHGFDAIGFDEGYAADRLRVDGVPSVGRSDFDRLRGTFDVVTAIEVIEHTVDPIAFLADIRDLLRPNGLLFLTTWNATRYRARLAKWRYVQPDVHVSFFEPATLAQAFHRVGLEPEYPGYVRGFTDLIRCKVLRNLDLHRRNRIEQCVPWFLVSRVVDRLYGIAAQPVARKVEPPAGGAHHRPPERSPRFPD